MTSASHVPAPLLNARERFMGRHFDLDGTALPPSDSLPPPRVVVVGGSIGGCCAAIALAAAGCDVQVHERTPGELPSQGAGLVIQPDMAAFLHHYGVCAAEDVAVSSSGRQYVDRDNAVVDGDDTPQLFSAWDVLHRALKAQVPAAWYHAGSAVERVDECERGGVRVVLSDGQTLDAELLVGADGAGSLVRSHFAPGVRSEYQGYAAWRGLAPEHSVPRHVLDFLGRKFTVFRGRGFHILAYLIPGEGGELSAGRRRVNWVWYWNHTAQELGDVLTDVCGHRHSYSLPRGMLRPEVAEERRLLARAILPSMLADLVDATADIFVQAIHDMLAPALAFADRAVLVGDAGCILRPHTAAGTTKAAINAWALAACLREEGNRLEPALRRYNSEMYDIAQRLVEVGQAIGDGSQFPERAGQR